MGFDYERGFPEIAGCLLVGFGVCTGYWGRMEGTPGVPPG